MNLRKLKLEDAPLMLEWMHDITVTEDLQTDFSAKTLADCESFITLSLHDRNNLHLAITDDYDIYMGTVSLKNMIASAAEFAIVIRKCAMGKGFSRYAMTEMLRIGTEEMGLRQIYWYVSPNNKRAIRFYEKNGYQRTTWDDVKILSRGGIPLRKLLQIFGICRRVQVSKTEYRVFFSPLIYAKSSA